MYMKVTLETKSWGGKKQYYYTFQNESSCSLLHPSRYVSDFLKDVTMCLADVPKQKHTFQLNFAKLEP